MHKHELNIAGIRKDYRREELNESIVGDNPLQFFTHWFDEAIKAEIDDVNAMTLATVDANNKPHARIVLLKGISNDGFVFFTNYNSAKGKNLQVNPNAALVFYWKELERQVRIEGVIEKTSTEESDEYFMSRPEGNRLGAWASPQSEVITDRNVIETSQKQFEEQFKNKPITRPEYWGGYRLIPHTIEFWQGRTNRLHDRIVFIKKGEIWEKSRLAP